MTATDVRSKVLSANAIAAYMKSKGGPSNAQYIRKLVKEEKLVALTINAADDYLAGRATKAAADGGAVWFKVRMTREAAALVAEVEGVEEVEDPKEARAEAKARQDKAAEQGLRDLGIEL